MSEVVGTALSGAPGVYAIHGVALRGSGNGSNARAPGISAERRQALDAGADQILYGQISIVRGRLRAEAALEDPATGRIVLNARGDGRSPSDVPAAGLALARGIANPARPFGTSLEAALKPYAEALDEDDPGAALAAIRRSIEADPSFGQAYLAGIRLAAALRDQKAVAELLASAEAHRAGMAPLDRARLEAEAAASRGDLQARVRALEVLTRLYPADPAVWTSLSDTALAAHRYPEAARYMRAAANLYPGDVLLANQLGYAEAYAGNLQGALAAGRRYAEMRPAEANPLDSLGDFCLHLNHLREAEDYYRQAWSKDPSFLDGGSLFKAAWARLMTGDVKEAGVLFERHLAPRESAGDRAAPLRRAQWLWLIGQRRKAIERLSAFQAAPEIAPVVSAQLELWKVQLGEGASPDFRKFGPVYGALLARDFPAALPLLVQAYARWTPGREPGLPVLLAWAYVETGRLQDAGPLLADRNPLPATGVDLATSLWFPRIFLLRAKVFEKQGDAVKARENTRIYRTLSGT
jgi:tetratricopeptide (TPR) repeat protein